MDGEFKIKLEPPDVENNEHDSFCARKLIKTLPFATIKVEQEEDSIGDIDIKIPTDHCEPFFLDNNSLPIVAEKSNIITISATESLKSKDELIFIQQITAAKKNCLDDRLILPSELKIDSVSSLYDDLEKSVGLYNCRKNCGRSFITLTQRSFHESYDHKRPQRTIKCNFCQKIFDDFFALTRHMAEHRNVKRYICSYCSKCFHSFKDLQYHSKTEKCEQESTPKKKSVNDSKEPVQSKALSFADETKAFVAKYQLKNEKVAKKRTSGFSKNCLNSFNLKKQKTKKADFDVSDLVPCYLNTAMEPLLNFQVKEEQKGEEIIANNDPNIVDHIYVKCGITETKSLDFFKVKNEPVDDEPSVKPQPAGLHNLQPKFQDNSVVPQKTVPCAHVELFKLSNSNCKASQPENDFSKPFQFQEKLINNENLLAFKNIKVLKLSPNVKLVKLPNKKVPSKPVTLPTLISTQETETIRIEKGGIENTLKHSKTILEIEKGEGNRDFSETDAKKNISSKRINITPKVLLSANDNQPEKRIIIEELQRQLKLAENNVDLTDSLSKMSTEKFSSDIDIVKMDTKSTNKNKYIFFNAEKRVEINTANTLKSPEKIMSAPSSPSSYFFRVNVNSDKQLMVARRLYKNYDFAWICPKCSRAFLQKHALIGHLVGTHEMTRSHFKDTVFEVKPFYSPVNPAKTLSSTQKSSEEGTVDLLNRPELECDKCSKLFSSHQKLIGHRSECGQLPQYKCTECHKSFFASTTLSCHKTIHTGILPHKCNFCDKRFRTRGQVTVHHRTHTGEKPFKCKVCTQAFNHRETLIAHVSRHIGLKRYRCNACGKHFSCVSGLKTHRNLRPDTCGLEKFDARAVGARVRVVRGQIMFEPQPKINRYIRNKEPQEILSEIQNIKKNKIECEINFRV